MRQPAASALAVALLALGCSGQKQIELRVYNWWEADSERYAFERVRQIHHRLHHNVYVQNLARPDVSQRQLVAGNLLAGAPPDTFQANLGADLLRWTVVDTQEEHPKTSAWLEDISDVFRGNDLFNQLPDELLRELRVGTSEHPKYFGVPINIHRLNLIYYNPHRLELYRQRTGKSFLDLGTLCPEVPAASGDPDLKIALDTTHGWVLVLLALENLLPALNGAPFYDSFFHGEHDPNIDYRAGVERALECFQHLSRSFIPGIDSWTAALEAVKNPDDRQGAAFTVSGDWANGQLDAELASGDVVAVPFPNTEQVFVYTADTFPLPIHSALRDDAKDLLDTLAARETQQAFSEEKGSVPARIDVQLGARATARHQSTDAFPRAAYKVLATSGRFPPYYPTNDLGDLLGHIVAPAADDPDPLQTALSELLDWSWLLTDWQERLAQGPADPTP